MRRESAAKGGTACARPPESRRTMESDAAHSGGARSDQAIVGLYGNQPCETGRAVNRARESRAGGNPGFGVSYDRDNSTIKPGTRVEVPRAGGLYVQNRPYVGFGHNRCQEGLSES